MILSVELKWAEEAAANDGFALLVAVLTWCIYYLSLHDEVQEKLYKEIVAVLGSKDPLNHQSIGKLK